MEQVVLYLAILAAVSGFAMGLANLVGPFLKRHNVNLPALNIAALLSRNGGDESDPATDNEDGSAVALQKQLLSNRRQLAKGIDDDEELDEELAGVLDDVAAQELAAGEAEDPSGEDQDEPLIYTISADAETEDQDWRRNNGESGAEDDGSGGNGESPGAAEEEVAEPGMADLLDAAVTDVAQAPDEDANEDQASDDDEEADEDEDEEADEDDEDEDEEGEEGEEDDEDEEDEDEDEAESTQPEVPAVSADAGPEDLMNLFGESSDDAPVHRAPWQDDLPEVSMDELLAEARAVNEQFQGNKKTDAA